MSAAALPARHGVAEGFTSRSQLVAHGQVAIHGRMGPPRPREEAKSPLSPARATVAEHIAHVEQLIAEAERASRPADRLREQLSAAMAELQKAEADLDGPRPLAVRRPER
jgi:hypothetical protein